MDFIFQIIVGCSVIALIFLSIGVFAMKKPLKLWGVFLFIVGIEVLYFYPEQRDLAVFMLCISILYFLKGIWIFAYRRNDVLAESRQEQSFFADMIRKIQNMRKRELLTRVICILGAGFFVLELFPFHKKVEEILEFLPYVAFVLLVIYYVSELFYIVLADIVAPLFARKEETRTARLKDALMIDRYIGRGVTVAQPYLFFEREEYYVSYRMFSKQIGEIAGYVCEYEVYRDILGNEFIKKCPRIVSFDRKFTMLVYQEDLKHGRNCNLIGERLPRTASSKNYLLMILLGFLFPILLIFITMLFLHIFVK